MQIVYYRDAEGKIRHHHDAPDGMTEERLKAEVEKFNQSDRGRTAHVIDVDAGSFCEYLIQRVKQGNRYTAETIEAAKDAIREALDAVESLQSIDCRNCPEKDKGTGGAADGKR